MALVTQMLKLPAPDMLTKSNRSPGVLVLVFGSDEVKSAGLSLMHRGRGSRGTPTENF